MCIYYFINFRFAPIFLSLLYAQQPQLLILFSSDAHKYIHTNKSTQKHTHTQTNPHRQTNREIWVAGEERIWVTGAWFVDRPVKKGSGLPSLVCGSAGEERIWVVELGLWIGWWRKDLCRRSLVRGLADEERIYIAGAWFVDRPMKKGSGSAGEERTQWRSDLGW